ncbi:MAG: hypothetical protein ACI81R_001730 [Bradymonadia bacterium]|jgi:hypothetical protein
MTLNRGAARRPTILLATCCLLALAPRTAASQTLDEAWERYEELSERFVDLQAECDAGDIRATTTNRLCREAVSSGFALADAIDFVLREDDSLAEGDRATLIDGMLTTRQISASIMVDLGECEEAIAPLEALLEHPEIGERPGVAEAAERWLNDANVCVEDRDTAARAALADPNESSAGPNIGAITLTSVGGAVLLSGLILDLSHLGRINDVRDSSGQCGLACQVSRNDDIEKIENARLPVALLYGIGGAAVVGGVIWMVADRPERDTSAWRLSPHAMRDRGDSFYGATLSGRF